VNEGGGHCTWRSECLLFHPPKERRKAKEGEVRKRPKGVVREGGGRLVEGNFRGKERAKKKQWLPGFRAPSGKSRVMGGLVCQKRETVHRVRKKKIEKRFLEIDLSSERHLRAKKLPEGSGGPHRLQGDRRLWPGKKNFRGGKKRSKS